jgi:hypothetical protein
MRKILSCLLILVITQTAVHAQRKGKSGPTSNLTEAEYDIWDDGEYFFENKNFVRAVGAFERLIKAHPKDPYFNYMLGLCYLNKSDEKELSLLYLLRADSLDSKLPDVRYYLGRAYHLNYKFDDAIPIFNDYIASNPPPEKKKMAQRYIEYCNNGKKLVEDEVEAQIDNIGGPVNTNNGEYVPVISADESILIFTYRGERSTGGLENVKLEPDTDGEYYEDIFISKKVNGIWTDPQSIGTNINTRGHDACIALSADGQKLFIFKSTKKDRGDIYMSTLTGTEWSKPVNLGKNINTNYWEGSVCLSADEKTLYFASERPGGFGGRDLYVTTRLPNGEWGKPVNLGPKINTPYNDDAPFLHADGKTLFFSSEGHNSMGEYDIFYTTIEGGQFTDPINLGYPVNTTEDDIYYVISADGERGYFSSNRKGGFGRQDIYVASPGFHGQKPVLALVVGTVKKDDKEVDATIHVTDSLTGEDKGTYHSNSATGKYIIALTPGVNYRVAFEVEGLSHVEYVNVKKIETFVQVDYNVNMYSEDYKKKNNITLQDSSSNQLNDKITQQLNKFNKENSSELCEARVYQLLLLNYGGVNKENVAYTVELGTYENENDFKAEKIRDLGPIQSKKDLLNHTTFSMGTFNTLYAAEQLRKKIFETDTSYYNMIVTVIESGKRKLLQEYYMDEYKKEGCVASTTPKVIASKTGIVSLQDDQEYQQILKDNGTKVIEGLSYKIEVCSTTDTGSLDVQRLAKYGKIEKKKYPDGVTRYTMGNFQTLKEAEEFKQMLVKNEPNLSCSFVTVFYFGQRKTVKEQFKDTLTTPPDTTVKTGPCKPDPTLDFSAFIGKDLNDKQVYAQLMAMGGGAFCVDGLIFTVQIGAYRHPQNFKYPQLSVFGPATIIGYPDGITRFTMKQFSTLRDAEAFRQQCIKKGISDAWITAIYKGKRMLLPELIAVNFYNRGVN